MFTLSSICGSHAELTHCLYNTSGELWNTGSSALNWKWTWKATPQHRSYSLLLKTGQKAGKSVPSLSNIPQNYSEDSSSPLTQLLQFWFFARSSSPDAISSLKSVRDQWPSFFLAGHQNRQHLPSDPLTVGGRPHSTASFFSFPWPNTITSRRLIPCSTQTGLVLGAKLPQKRCTLGGLPDGGFCSSPWSVSSSICQNVSSNEVLLARRA